jgi:hypothetical protein
MFKIWTKIKMECVSTIKRNKKERVIWHIMSTRFHFCKKRENNYLPHNLQVSLFANNCLTSLRFRNILSDGLQSYRIQCFQHFTLIAAKNIQKEWKKWVVWQTKYDDILSSKRNSNSELHKCDQTFLIFNFKTLGLFPKA